MKANLRMFFISLFLIFWCIACGYSHQDGSELRRISSDTILNQLNNGSAVNYENVEVYGDLDLTIFHSPVNSNEDNQSGQSTEIIESPIYISGSTFDGNVKFREKIFKNPLKFENSVILGSADFKGSSFTNETSFNGSIFNNTAEFSKSHFYKDICFKNCIFKRDCRFTRSIFEKNLSFKNADFFDDISFIKATFKENVEFENSANYRGIAYFLDSSFMKNANIVGSRFEGAGTMFSNAEFGGLAQFLRSSFTNADFTGSKFNGETKIVNGAFNGKSNFSSAIFNEDAVFFSTFKDDVRFDKSQFKQEASFKRALFNGSAIFNEAEFSKRAQFSDATFGGFASFNESRFYGDALFEGAELKGKLFLKRAKYDKLFIRWHNISNLAYDDSAYLLLIENFKKLGFWSDADECYCAYRSERNQYLPAIYRPVDWMLFILYGYGTRPELPLFWFISAIIIFGLIFYKIGGIRKDNKNLSIMDFMYFSATNIASGTKTLGSFVSEPEDFQAVEKFQYLVILERFLGMLFFALFLTSLARTIIR